MHDCIACVSSKKMADLYSDDVYDDDVNRQYIDVMIYNLNYCKG